MALQTTTPKPRTTVTVGNETREVIEVKNGRVYYGWPERLAVRSVILSAWHAWAARAANAEPA